MKAEQPAYLPLDPAAPSDYWLAGGAASVLPQAPKAGMSDLPSGSIGWFDYDFQMTKPGWRKLVVEAKGSTERLELDIDAPKERTARPGPYRVGDWVWLDAGAHRLRLLSNIWTGLPRAITAIRLELPARGQPGAFRFLPNWEKPVSAIGACAPVRFLAGGSDKESQLLLLFTDESGGVIGREAFTISPSSSPQSFDRPVPCSSAGRIKATLRMGGGPMRGSMEATQFFEVVDTSPAKASFEKGRLALDVNAAEQAPDHQSGETNIVESGGLKYRESADRGTLAFSRRRTTIPASWFAYNVKGLTPGKSYFFQVDYPDNKNRVFIVAFRQFGESSYPVSLGMETGGVWPLSEKMATRSAIVWPTSDDGRAILYNYFDGQKAPLARVSFYEANENITPLSSPFPDRAGLRDVAYFFEEGGNFKMLVGGKDKALPTIKQVDRYARLAAFSGGSLLVPAVVVYASQLYPSRYNLTFQDWGTDVTAAFLLTAQKYGLKVAPELAPRADELLWTVETQEDMEKRLLISKDGKMRLTEENGKILRPPYYNPIDSIVRRWYIDMVGELADRYKAHPNFAGIQLRLSDWQNPALNNLVSLEWGYAKETVALFLKEKNVTAVLPLADNAPASIKERSAFLLSPDMREIWIAWRCEKMRDILRDIVIRVRKARSDLKVSVSFFALSAYRQPDAQKLREKGIDIDLLQQVEGLVLVDGRFQHGPKEDDKGWQDYMRTGAMKPEGIGLFSKNNQRPSTLYPMQYMEITGDVTPSAALGWPTTPKGPWISAASEPPDRLKLARYAELVGLYDVFMIGDGGNGYVFADEALKEFFTEFCSLPRRAFEKVIVSAKSVAVRRSGDILYVVNLSAKANRVDIHLPDVTQVARRTTGENVPVENGVMRLDLEAYQLRTFDLRLP